MYESDHIFSHTAVITGLLFHNVQSTQNTRTVNKGDDFYRHMAASNCEYNDHE